VEPVSQALLEVRDLRTVFASIEGTAVAAYATTGMRA
jgi:hypothetical protein